LAVHDQEQGKSATTATGEDVYAKGRKATHARKTGEATNAWIAVQSKGRTTLEKESDSSFEFTCTPRDLDYWRRGNMPVLLVVSRPARNEAWWVSVKDYFRTNPSRQQSRRILFDKQANALTAAAAGQLLQLVQAAGAGTYFRPAPRRERLRPTWNRRPSSKPSTAS
jgi:hypothetical protein